MFHIYQPTGCCMLSSRPKVLLLGGGYADIPVIKAIKKLGFDVVSTGNVPESPGHQYSDLYEFGDFSNPNQMLAIARRHDVVGCVPSCNDFAAISAAYVSEVLGLNGFDSVECSMVLHHKDRFRDFCRSIGVPAPESAGSFTDQSEAAEYVASLATKVIVKPVDLTGGKGISTVNRGEDPRDAIMNALSLTKAGRIVIEHFIEGSRHGYSAIIVRGKVVFGFLDNEHYEHNPFMVAAASVPSILADDVKKSVDTIIEVIAENLSLVDGIFHVQFIMSARGPVIIEVCRRPPGDLYVDFVSKSTGYDYAAAIVKGFLGIPLDQVMLNENVSPFVRYCVMSEYGGRVRNVVYSRELQEMIADEYRLWYSGQLVTNPLVHKYAILFLRLKTGLDIMEQVGQIKQLYQINLESS